MLKQLLSFDTLFGARLIRVVYFIGLAAIALFQVASLLLLLDGDNSLPFIVVLFGPAFALLLWRFSCELSILSFRIADDLRDIKLNMLAQPTSAE